jgi:hypothetical protein
MVENETGGPLTRLTIAAISLLLSSDSILPNDEFRFKPSISFSLLSMMDCWEESRLALASMAVNSLLFPNESMLSS